MANDLVRMESKRLTIRGERTMDSTDMKTPVMTTPVIKIIPTSLFFAPKERRTPIWK